MTAYERYLRRDSDADMTELEEAGEILAAEFQLNLHHFRKEWVSAHTEK
jgi:hypothetical protein